MLPNVFLLRNRTVFKSPVPHLKIIVTLFLFGNLLFSLSLCCCVRLKWFIFHLNNFLFYTMAKKQIITSEFMHPLQSFQTPVRTRDHQSPRSVKTCLHRLTGHCSKRREITPLNSTYCDSCQVFCLKENAAWFNHFSPPIHHCYHLPLTALCSHRRLSFIVVQVKQSRAT